MLTLRENLLSRPWQERRYMNHRHKVETALPVIDNHPPALRKHVSCKMKKIQKERERCAQIVSDNFTLLQHLGYIRNTCRVDNYWEESPPNFLNKVGIYRIRENSLVPKEGPDVETERPNTRKGRCLGCHPARYVRKVTIPEERVPFPPPKKRTSAKPEDPLEVETKNTRDDNHDKDVLKMKTKKVPSPKRSQSCSRTRRDIQRETQSLELSRGDLTLKIRFPSDSGLVFSDKGKERVIQREWCRCASRPKNISRTP